MNNIGREQGAKQFENIMTVPMHVVVIVVIFDDAPIFVAGRTCGSCGVREFDPASLILSDLIQERPQLPHRFHELGNQIKM